MIIDVKKLNAEKKYSGHIRFDYTAPEELISIPFVKFSSPVKVEADYELYEDNSLELKGKIVYGIEGQCSRCLEPASQTVEGEIDAYFQPFTGGEDYSYSGGVIKLQDAVNDAIMASMPYSLSCGDDCAGIRYPSQTTEK
jgi:uncharacterized metal-binding protein YceD (DUF177 family)